MSTPIVIQYPLDPTGSNPNNLVSGEPVSLPSRPVRAFAPAYGAFFAASMVITDVATGQVITPGTQYYAGEMYQVPTEMFGQEVAAIVVITDSTVSNNLSIQYQAVGGQFSASNSLIANIVNTLNADNRPVAWAQIVNKPPGFVPSHHLHDLGDLYGFEYITFELERIRNAILTGDEVSHDQIYKYIDANIGNVTASYIAAINASMAAHLAAANPHPQYANPYALVRTPVNVTPAANLTGTNTNIVLTASTYYSLYGVAQGASEFRASVNSGCVAPYLFDTTINGAGVSYTPPSFSNGTTYYWQARYQDIEGNWSAWSTATSFTTLTAAIVAPTITLPVSGSSVASVAVTLTASAFASTGVTDTQLNTDWEIWTGPNGTGTLVWSSEANAVNLNSITVPSNALAISTIYYPRVRYRGNILAASAWSSSVSFTTLAAGLATPSVVTPTNNSSGASVSALVLTGTPFTAIGITDTQKATNWELYAAGVVPVESPITIIPATPQIFTTSGNFTPPAGVTILTSVVGNGAPGAAIQGIVGYSGSNTWQAGGATLYLGTGYTGQPNVSFSGSNMISAPSANVNMTQLYSWTQGDMGPGDVSVSGTVPNGTYTLWSANGEVGIYGMYANPSYDVTIVNNVCTSVSLGSAGLAGNGAETSTFGNFSNLGNGNSISTGYITGSASAGYAATLSASGGEFNSSADYTATVSGGGGSTQSLSMNVVPLTTVQPVYGTTGYSTGASSTAFGLTFVGSSTTAAATAVTDNNVVVIPGTAYPIVVPAGGSVTVNYNVESGGPTNAIWSSEGDTANLTSVTVPPAVLTNNTQYQARVQYVGNILGNSAWSAMDVFVVGTPGINTPAILTPANGATGLTAGPLTLTATPFSTFGTTDTQLSSSWEVWAVSAVTAQSQTFTANGTFTPALDVTTLTSVVGKGAASGVVSSNSFAIVGDVTITSGTVPSSGSTVGVTLTGSYFGGGNYTIGATGYVTNNGTSTITVVVNISDVNPVGVGYLSADTNINGVDYTLGSASINTSTSYTTGASATAFGDTFPGGNTSGVDNTTTFTNVPVLAEGSYPIVVPAGGSVIVNYSSGYTLAWSDYNDVTNFSSVSIPSGVLVNSTEYKARILQTGHMYGNSPWSPMSTFSTSSQTFAFNIAGGMNVDLHAAALAAGWDGSMHVTATVTANIGSSSVSASGLTVAGSFPNGASVIINSGIYVVGAGGAPGINTSVTGGNGGTAITATSAVSITNNGTIGGGGGGGADNGGVTGGGGGAGLTAGGSSNGGAAGTLTTGGAGASNSNGVVSGSGGNLGQAGGAAYSGAQGGSAGIAIQGASLVTWVIQGTVLGVMQG